jgi:hypothetical protein
VIGEACLARKIDGDDVVGLRTVEALDDRIEGGAAGVRSGSGARGGKRGVPRQGLGVQCLGSFATEAGSQGVCSAAQPGLDATKDTL